MKNHPSIDHRTPHLDLAPASLRGARAALIDEMFGLFFAAALQKIDLSFNEWVAVLGVHPGSITERRTRTVESAAAHAQSLAMTVTGETGSARLAGKIRAMPKPMQLAIVEMIDRFWLAGRDVDDLEKWLERQGVRVAATAHDRMNALSTLQARSARNAAMTARD